MYAALQISSHASPPSPPCPTISLIFHFFTIPKIRSGAKTASSIFAGVAGAVALNSRAALAVGSGGLSEANKKLAEYGQAPILFVPQGLTPLVSEYGRGSIKNKMNNPILVQFFHPGAWVQQRTTVNKNGEAGTVAANDYMKGDSAAFFSVSDTKLPSDKASAAALILKALSQKGDPVDDLKIKTFTEGE